MRPTNDLISIHTVNRIGSKSILLLSKKSFTILLISWILLLIASSNITEGNSISKHLDDLLDLEYLRQRVKNATRLRGASKKLKSLKNSPSLQKNSTFPKKYITIFKVNKGSKPKIVTTNRKQTMKIIATMFKNDRPLFRQNRGLLNGSDVIATTTALTDTKIKTDVFSSKIATRKTPATFKKKPARLTEKNNSGKMIPRKKSTIKRVQTNKLRRKIRTKKVATTKMQPATAELKKAYESTAKTVPTATELKKNMATTTTTLPTKIKLKPTNIIKKTLPTTIKSKKVIRTTTLKKAIKTKRKKVIELEKQQAPTPPHKNSIHDDFDENDKFFLVNMKVSKQIVYFINNFEDKTGFYALTIISIITLISSVIISINNHEELYKLYKFLFLVESTFVFCNYVMRPIAQYILRSRD
ncbi:hypothetical protein HELRODRAFT_172707 [Helobdella robusta]|uniref:Uncharacterized protein n=1 Tax=Helobdella robusta TaxID=6412 RepID=T1F5U0_HELRO|nr:hypothetical protein HELRODRAFT_172707 [Helobdella robusta]ESO04344.1 hypothetical protein HELRODRAFT_172707 [Helobdella robusta]